MRAYGGKHICIYIYICYNYIIYMYIIVYSSYSGTLDPEGQSPLLRRQTWEASGA